MQMWNKSLLPHLRTFYNNCGLTSKLQNEEIYLHNAFKKIDQLWKSNLNQISSLKYIMLSESPLWGEAEKYIYNPRFLRQSSFFTSNQLKKALILKRTNPLPALVTKQDFVSELNKMGFLIVDVSPFALNKLDTSIRYSQLSGRKKNHYYQLIQPTLNNFFNDCISQIKSKLSDESNNNVKVFYRYPRIEKHLGV